MAIPYKATLLGLHADEETYSHKPAFQCNFVSFTADTVMSAGDLSGGLYVHATDANDRTLTTPTGAQLDACYPKASVDTTMEFVVVETNAGNQTTLTAGASGVTLVGSAITLDSTSSSYWARRTAADTWIFYQKGESA